MTKVLIIATSRKTRGGITSVIKAHKTGEQWQKYQHSFDYAKEISLKETCDSVIEVMNRLEL